MVKIMNDSPSETDHLFERLRAGDRPRWPSYSSSTVTGCGGWSSCRMDTRLQGRIDASDVLQEGFLDWRSGWTVSKRPSLPVFLWLRLVVERSAGDVHRHHLGTRMRDVGQEVSLYRDPMPQASSAALASMLLGRLTTPSNAAIRAEQILQVQEAVNSLDPLDREIVVLRHFEQLNRAETAEVLGITEEAGAKRYIRALKKLKSILAAMPGGREGP